MDKKISIFIIILFICSSPVFGQQPIKILFLGNSFTNAYNMPALVEGLANEANIPNQITMYAPGGMYVYTTSSITGHDSSTVTESYIVSTNWDFIVVQDNQGGYVWSEGYINPMITDANLVLFNKIKNNNICTRVIYFAGWGFEGGLPSQYWNSGGLNLTSDNTHDLNDRIYHQFVHMNDSLFNEIVTPIGLAWNTCLAEQPTIDLYSGDSMHPNLEGAYLGASTIFSSIFKIDPTNIAYDAGLSPTIAQYLRATGYNTVITDTVFVACNLDEYTPIIEFYQNEISTPQNYTAYQWVLNNSYIPSAFTNPFTIAVDGNYGLVVTDSSGCQHRSFDLYCQMQVGTKELNGNDEFELFPNPACEFVIVPVENNSTTSISLYNTTGKLLKHIVSDENYQMNIAELSAGVYYMKIKSRSTDITKKLIVIDNF